MSELVTDERLDELILMAENADGMWSDESSRTALAGWRELKALREVVPALRDALTACMSELPDRCEHEREMATIALRALASKGKGV